MEDYLARMIGMHTWTWEWQAIVRLLAAALLGAAVGAEREREGRAAGLRTLMLVSLGAAMAMVVSVHFANVFASTKSEAIRLDPARVAYGVMVGIGFLGAGVIVRRGTGVHGLTTAAGLWCTAAIGLACGFGMFTVALAGTGMVVIVLQGRFRLDRLVPTKSIKFLSATLPSDGEDTVRKLREWIRSRGGSVNDVQCERDLSAGTETITFEISLPANVSATSLLELTREEPRITRIAIR